MKKTLLTAFLMLSALLVGYANAADFHPIEDVTVTTSPDGDLWAVSALIQGPGEGYSTDEPHDGVPGSADTLWVTNDDAGFPADYIEEVGQPVVQLDLGADRTLKEISAWGYSGTNSNGTSQFSLRFATEAEADGDDIFGDIEYGQSITYNPTFELFSDPVPQQIKLFEEHVTARFVEFTNLDNFFILPGDGSEPTEEPLPRLLPVLPGGDRVGLGEIAFMDLPESFQPGDLLARKIEGDDFGSLDVSSLRSGQEFGPSGDLEPGLAQSWYGVANPGNRDGVLNVIASNDPVVPTFRGEDGSWWSGSDDVSDVPKYPIEVDGVITGDNYTVKLDGEILIEESGAIQFLDGVDDYTYLAIDIDRSGVAGDTEEEVLINDNTWTNALSTGNGGASIVEVDFENIAAGGEWLAFEFNAAEGGGGDSGMLYWDAMDEDGFFPLDQGEGILDIDAAVFLIPDSHLRSATSELIKADATGSLADAIGQPNVFELNVQVGPNGNDQVVVEDKSVGEGTTVLDVSGATVRVVAADGIADGTEFRIFGADSVTGIDSLNLLFDDASLWDLSNLSSGVLVFGAPMPGLAGDINNSGTVDFADFLILSNNFGTMVAANMDGDLDGDGNVAFADFLILSDNFGTAAAASSVPEPSSFALIAVAGLLGGLLRRRRD